MSRNLSNLPKKPITPEAKRQAVLLVINTLILIFIYFGSQNIGQPVLSMIVTAGYWLVLSAMLIIYIVYNRAFTRKGITVDMLPDDWELEKKQEFVADAENRVKRSKWMLTVIIPLMITCMLDLVYLFTWPMLQNLFNI